MTAPLAPFTLEPVLVEKPWGGRRLEGLGTDLPDFLMIGESWEVADLPDEVAPDVADPRSRVSSGPLLGCSLRSVIEAAGEELLGTVMPTHEGRFPLLVKLLDARENLSVQVHPDEEYVATHPTTRLKTESWYVVDSDPGSVLFNGLREGSDLDTVRKSIGTSDLVQYLRATDPAPGSFHHVPAGLVHSLGAGVMVAEVQTPSDTTFRLYDWAAEYGRAPRQMHFEEGAASIIMHPPEAYSLAPTSEPGVRELTANQHYWIREHRHASGLVELSGLPGPRVIMIMSGVVAVGDLTVRKGATAIVPAAAIPSTVAVVDDSVFLEIGLTA